MTTTVTKKIKDLVPGTLFLRNNKIYAAGPPTITIPDFNDPNPKPPTEVIQVTDVAFKDGHFFRLTILNFSDTFDPNTLVQPLVS